MPTYVYRFVDTGETFEVQQTFDEQALTEAEHPTTGRVMPVRKVFTPVGVTFKGGGFYKTDSRAKTGAGRKQDAKAAATESSSTDSASSGSGSGGKDSSSTSSSQSSSKSSSKDAATTTAAAAGRD
jgi:predicted nucleic acid-binding Zn ribbon protein